MPAYNFKEQFVVPIRSGRKKHTIRARRARATRPGERLMLYTGMRTKRCQKIIPDVVCTKVEGIEIHEWTVRVDGNILFADECEALAVADGFPSFAHMMHFWKGRLPFEGEIIHWRLA